MSNLLKTLQKASTSGYAELLSESKMMNAKDVIRTNIPALNIALSGSIDGGLTSGLTVLAGPSKHFKSNLGLVLVASYLKKYDDAICVFIDTEFGITPSYLKSCGVDPSRVLHIQCETVERIKMEMANQLEAIKAEAKSSKKNPHVIFFMDSIGNVASSKEVNDALDEKTTVDMTRAKQVKSLFRIVTPYFTMLDIPCVTIAHTYQTQEMYSKSVISGGCVVADTKITMSDSTLKSVQDIEVGEYVKTMNGHNMVTHTWNPDTLLEGEPECYEIEFEDGYKVTCSDKHKFLIDGKWVEAKDLVVGAKSTANDATLEIKSIKTVGKKKVYDLSVADVEHYILENGVVTHNTGIMYSADTAIILGKQQEKDGKDIVGYHFIMNIEKSRFVREKAKVPLTVTYEKGIDPYSGLLELAIGTGHVIKPSNGWYARKEGVDEETGEIILSDKKREKDTHNLDFWRPILRDPTFNQAIKDKYTLGQDLSDSYGEGDSLFDD